MFKQYYYLTKPGIVRGNAIVAAGGFFLASRGTIDWMLFGAMFFGIAFIMASACVLNNYIDRGIDAKMLRTQKRALVQKTISVPAAMIFAFLLGVGGSLLLGIYTNLLALCTALVGVVFYVILYGIAKRSSVHGTLVGSIPGAVPPVVGYVSVTNSFDIGAFLLFVMLVLWQMPHFYAIALFRLEDYRAAGIPALPLVQGASATKEYMILYIIAFFLTSPALFVFGMVGYWYLVVMLVVGLVWLVLGMRGFKAEDDAAWGKKMFRFSLVVLMAFSIMIGINSI